MPIEKWSDSIIVVHVGDDPLFSEDMDALEKQPPPIFNIVLDFAAVRTMNSSNIASLLRIRRILVTNDARLILCNVSNQVWSTLLVTGLDKIFDVSESVSTSLATIQMNEPKKPSRRK
jgi:anti-anti-sigma factor